MGGEGEKTLFIGDSFPSQPPPEPNSAGAQVAAQRQAEVIFQPEVFEVNSFFGQDDKGIYYRKSLASMIYASRTDSNKSTFAWSTGLRSPIHESLTEAALTFLRETQSALLMRKLCTVHAPGCGRGGVRLGLRL